jgi:hypothetical protein
MKKFMQKDLSKAPSVVNGTIPPSRNVSILKNLLALEYDITGGFY